MLQNNYLNLDMKNYTNEFQCRSSSDQLSQAKFVIAISERQNNVCLDALVT
jgi:hypothetical protein